MKGIIVEQKDGNPTLVWTEVDDVSCATDEVLVDVRATAVNRADLSQAAGNYPPPPGSSPLLGLEMAGVIAEVGEDVANWNIGDRVCALLPGGGYAERVTVPAGMLIPLPDDWTFAMGAALPEVWLTAFVNMFTTRQSQIGGNLAAACRRKRCRHSGHSNGESSWRNLLCNCRSRRKNRTLQRTGCDVWG